MQLRREPAHPVEVLARLRARATAGPGTSPQQPPALQHFARFRAAENGAAPHTHTHTKPGKRPWRRWKRVFSFHKFQQGFSQTQIERYGKCQVIAFSQKLSCSQHFKKTYWLASTSPSKLKKEAIFTSYKQLVSAGSFFQQNLLLTSFLKRLIDVYVSLN